jgi:hypothetical protein
MVAYQKSDEIKLACKSYTQDTLLLNFKITLKAFSFKLKSSNKSFRARLQENNKTGLTIFGFFYKFLSIFKVDSFELGRGTDISQKRH